jgi:hypothetical protein
MTRFDLDGSTVGDLMTKHSDTLKRVAEVGKSSGAIHHQFLQDSDGALIALDEWESEDAYHRFFDGQDDLKAIMADAHLAGPPASTTYREVEAPDRF